MAFDQCARRSRYTRQPIGKHIRLTSRDTDILCQLYRYRYLTSKQLIDLLRPTSEKKLVERLGDLFHETGLIDRPKAQWRFAGAKSQHAIYELSDQGMKWLSQHGIKPNRVTLFSRRERLGVRTQFEHRLLVITHLVRMEIEALKSPDHRFVSVDEILKRAPSATQEQPNPLALPLTIAPSQRLPERKRPLTTHLIPDAIYGIGKIIEGEKRFRFFALEVERTSPKKRGRLDLSSSDKKTRLYAELQRQGVAKQHLGLPHLQLEIVQPDGLL